MAIEKVKKKKVNRDEIDRALIDNFINLQKVLTNLSVKFDDLSGNISKLLQLFEISAKSFADGGNKAGLDEDFLKKLDSLLDQNKVISKGIMMMEDRIRGRGNVPTRPSGHQPPREAFKSRPLPRY